MKSLVFVLLMGLSMTSLAVYRCEINGKVEYSDRPCAGKQTTIDITTRAPDKADVTRYRRAVQAEKDFVRESQAETARINAQRSLEYDQTAMETKMHLRQRMTCKELLTHARSVEDKAQKYKNDENWRELAARSWENYITSCPY